MPLTKAKMRKPTVVNAADPEGRAARVRPEIVAAVLVHRGNDGVLVRRATAGVLGAKVNAADHPAEAVAISIEANRVSGARLRRRCPKLIWP